MRILLLLFSLFFFFGCSSQGYDRHYIISDVLEETLSPLPTED